MLSKSNFGAYIHLRYLVQEKIFFQKNRGDTASSLGNARKANTAVSYRFQ
ncbi:uncharacterized protein PHALS_10848 [Plasmopara halstedii]|uniref:Uncharacterized protein n=1 Tax=Plasmopara halstedii TaxID=4781 RepID=A0A0P1AHQ1_PLAHL|nr:uncharacterized protein PHALS_10848 [Plasmopara halstedii]CEG40662.1 hypothetical protein PHALS_10848 [Plasmopara halstedii]|eukprot:XP_024577031.1 hypothetical protein PHALS_10848 [Plasmopara halstedii]